MIHRGKEQDNMEIDFSIKEDTGFYFLTDFPTKWNS